MVDILFLDLGLKKALKNLSLLKVESEQKKSLYNIEPKNIINGGRSRI